MRRTTKGKASLKRAREEIKVHNARVPMRRAMGINSASVFQGPTRVERKYIDQNTTLQPALAGTSVKTLLNGCAQGTDAPSNRIGRETSMKSIYWMLYGSIAATTTGAAPFRLVIVYDKESNGVAATASGTPATDAFNQDNIGAQMNLDQRDRFIVLVDEIIDNIGTAGPQSLFRKGYRKISLPCVFNATGGATIASINTGGIYAFLWNGGTFATLAPTLNLSTRIRFEDA